MDGPAELVFRYMVHMGAAPRWDETRVLVPPGRERDASAIRRRFRIR